MTVGSREISLRGDGPWQGLGDSTTMLPGTPTFRRLEGCYISKDGTEIRRVPGSKAAGYPFAGEPFDIFSLTPGDPTRVVLDVTAIFEFNTANPAYDPTAYGHCYVTGNADIPTGYYAYTRVNKSTIDIDYNSTGGEGNTDGKILLNRSHAVHAITHADDRTVLVHETYARADDLPYHRHNVGSVVAPSALSFTSPIIPSYPKDPDDGFVLWKSPTMRAINDNEPQNNPGWHIQMPSRMQADVLNGRVLIAVPGHGCMFEANLRAGMPNFPYRPPTYSVADHRWTRMLGIPKGIIASVIPSSTGGSISATATTAPVTLRFAIGYYDIYTGEVGLPSDEFEATLDITTSTGAFLVQAYKPRFAAPETAGLGVVIYASGANPSAGAELFPMRLLNAYETADDSNLYSDLVGAVISTIPNDAPAVWVAPQRYPRIEQPPTGAGALRVVKSRLIYGAAVPRFWRFKGWWDRDTTDQDHPYYRILVPYDKNATMAAKVYTETVLGEITAVSPIAWGRIPNAYAGSKVFSGADDDELLSGRMIGTAVDSSQNAVVGAGTNQTNDWPHGIQIDFDPDPNNPTASPPTPDGIGIKEYLIENFSDLTSYSEEGFPGVSVGIMRMENDYVRARSVIGYGRINDALLVFTDRSTTLFTWSVEPRKASGQELSPIYGCISPGSVVDGPFGCAWLSHEGPCVFRGNGVEWIGKPIHQFFRSLPRDSGNLMNWVTATVDTDRELVIWGIRTNDTPYSVEGSETAYAIEGGTEWGSTEGQEALGVPADWDARYAANAFLIWSYATGQFTVDYRYGLERVQALGAVPFDDGVLRAVQVDVTNFVPSVHYQTIYGWDDSAAIQRATPVQWACTVKRAAGNAYFYGTDGSNTVGEQDIANRIVAPAQAFIRSKNGDQCRWYGWVTDITADTHVELGTLVDGVTWDVGDVLYTHVRNIRIETNRIRLAQGIGFEGEISGVVIRTDGDATYAYVDIVVEDENGNEVRMTRNRGDRLRYGTQRFASGHFRATEIIVKVSILADAQVRVKDIALEVPVHEE